MKAALAQFIASFTSARHRPLLWLLPVVHSALLVFLGLGVSLSDRKLGADVQMRIGPNRVGPWHSSVFGGYLKAIAKQDVVLATTPAFLQDGAISCLGVGFAASGPSPSLNLGRCRPRVVLYSVLMPLCSWSFSRGAPLEVIGQSLCISLHSCSCVLCRACIVGALSVVVIAGGASFSKIIGPRGRP